VLKIRIVWFRSLPTDHLSAATDHPPATPNTDHPPAATDHLPATPNTNLPAATDHLPAAPNTGHLRALREIK